MKLILDIACKECGDLFSRSHTNARVCSDACRKQRRNRSVEAHRIANKPQYAKKQAKARAKNLTEMRHYQKMRRYLSWEYYLASLARRGQERKGITTQDLLAILEEQKGLCAISGIKLTHEHGSPYNASLDRIEAGGLYTKENIQLVCSCVNIWRKNLPLELFIDICKKIATHNE